MSVRLLLSSLLATKRTGGSAIRESLYKTALNAQLSKPYRNGMSRRWNGTEWLPANALVHKARKFGMEMTTRTITKPSEVIDSSTTVLATVWYPPNRLICLYDTGSLQRYVISDDGGQSWGTPVTIAFSGKSRLTYQTGNIFGRLYLTTGIYTSLDGATITADSALAAPRRMIAGKCFNQGGGISANLRQYVDPTTFTTLSLPPAGASLVHIFGDYVNKLVFVYAGGSGPIIDVYGAGGSGGVRTSLTGVGTISVGNDMRTLGAINDDFSICVLEGTKTHCISLLGTPTDLTHNLPVSSTYNPVYNSVSGYFYVIITTGGLGLYKSADGITWTSCSIPYPTGAIFSIAVASGKYNIYSFRNSLYIYDTSTDTWVLDDVSELVPYVMDNPTYYDQAAREIHVWSGPQHRVIKLQENSFQPTTMKEYTTEGWKPTLAP